MTVHFRSQNTIDINKIPSHVQSLCAIDWGLSYFCEMHTAVMKMIIEKLNPRVVRKSYYKIFPIIHLEIICDLIHELKSLIRQSVVLQNFSEYSSVPWWICSSKKNCSRKWFTFDGETDFWETLLAPIKLQVWFWKTSPNIRQRPGEFALPKKIF